MPKPLLTSRTSSCPAGRANELRSRKPIGARPYVERKSSGLRLAKTPAPPVCAECGKRLAHTGCKRCPECAQRPETKASPEPDKLKPTRRLGRRLLKRRAAAERKCWPGTWPTLAWSSTRPSTSRSGQFGRHCSWTDRCGGWTFEEACAGGPQRQEGSRARDWAALAEPGGVGRLEGWPGPSPTGLNPRVPPEVGALA